MSRKFAIITTDDLRKKIEERWKNDNHQMVEDLQDDLKCKFDLENFEDGENHYNKELAGLTGCVTLSNGLTLCGMTAGGDWEHPVYFLVYWDGKKLRAYVPTDGNPWNTTTKQAYGNDAPADAKNAKKRYPGQYDDAEEDDDFEGDFGFDGKAILADILERIEPANGATPAKKARPTPKGFQKKTIEICEHDACVVRHALAQQLKRVSAEIVILKLTKTRDLNQEERWQLPANLQQMSRSDLQEQIDPWISLEMTIQGLIDTFKIEE